MANELDHVKLSNTTYEVSDAAVRERVTALENSGSAVQYSKTLTTSGWTSSGTYTLSIPTLKCGGSGTVSPLIAPADSSNHEEYDKIATAMATAGTGIVFTKSSSATINANISIIIIDFQ